MSKPAIARILYVRKEVQPSEIDSWVQGVTSVQGRLEPFYFVYIENRDFRQDFVDQFLAVLAKTLKTNHIHLLPVKKLRLTYFRERCIAMKILGYARSKEFKETELYLAEFAVVSDERYLDSTRTLWYKLFSNKPGSGITHFQTIEIVRHKDSLLAVVKYALLELTKRSFVFLGYSTPVRKSDYIRVPAKRSKLP